MSCTRILSAILILAAFAFAQDANSRQIDFNKIKINPANMDNELKIRENLLQALKTGNTSKIDSALLVLSYGKIPEAAIDSLEILQINIIRERYDLAIPQLANILMKEGQKVRYSFANDSLVVYLRQKTQYATYYKDSPYGRSSSVQFHKKFMTEATQASIKQEYRDLASILVDLISYYTIIGKKPWAYNDTVSKDSSIDSLANIVAVRAEKIWMNFYSEADTLAAKPLIEKMQAFYKNYPESEYSDWIYKNITNFNSHIERFKRHKNYYLDKLYTGGLGFEVFIGNSSSFLIGIPLQFSRFILTPLYIHEKDSYTTKNGYETKVDNLNFFSITVGFDAFENKRLKIQPFIGLIMTGLQVDYRFWMNKDPPSYNIGSYLSLKFRYMGIYYFPATEGRKKWGNRFFVGIGGHIW